MSIHAPHFQNEEKAREYLEKLQWPDGPICPHCGTVDHAYATKRPGKYRCASKECRKDFSVTVGTVFERSHIPLHKWLLASYLLCSSKKGISSHQLHRMLGVTYKTAWFMSHRIREAMKPKDGSEGPMGGFWSTVEVDETYIGNKQKKRPGARGYAHKHAVVSLVERGGRVKSHHVERVTAETLRPILNEQIKKDTILMTDEAAVYQKLGQEFAMHGTTQHGIGEYVRGNVHTNTIEGYFSIFKRGMNGVYQHCSEEHLKRYLAEFDFRYNEREITDVERSNVALHGIKGKRLTYRPAC